MINVWGIPSISFSWSFWRIPYENFIIFFVRKPWKKKSEIFTGLFGIAEKIANNLWRIFNFQKQISEKNAGKNLNLNLNLKVKSFWYHVNIHWRNFPRNGQKNLIFMRSNWNDHTTYHWYLRIIFFEKSFWKYRE